MSTKKGGIADMTSMGSRQFGMAASNAGTISAPISRISSIPETEHLMTPGEVAALFRVDPKTVTRWAKAGKLTSIRTLGGHRRYRSSEVRSLLEKSGARIGDGI